MGCDCGVLATSTAFRISTHTSRVGCDFPEIRKGWLCANFYSHIPCGMWRTSRLLDPGGCYFYSHIPCGMWRVWDYSAWRLQRFLLTHPVWDVTYCGECGCKFDWFLLTHPVWDVTMPCGLPVFHVIFLLTHPVWDVTLFFCSAVMPCKISTHTSRVGCDIYSIKIK